MKRKNHLLICSLIISITGAFVTGCSTSGDPNSAYIWEWDNSKSAERITQQRSELSNAQAEKNLINQQNRTLVNSKNRKMAELNRILGGANNEASQLDQRLRTIAAQGNKIQQDKARQLEVQSGEIKSQLNRIARTENANDNEVAQLESQVKALQQRLLNLKAEAALLGSL